ncbi:MAG: hypothetical protein JW932_20420 [Deltaproteobacteria bacterium]|nr:hypothetical protein [Deltaproteobacteria bacterium]
MDIQKDTWLWVVVQDTGGSEMFLGQHDERNNESFIPVFLEKGDAQIGLEQLVREKDKKYEVQAIQYGLLAQYAFEKGFMVFILNAAGEVLYKLENPAVHWESI